MVKLRFLIFKINRNIYKKCFLDILMGEKPAFRIVLTCAIIKNGRVLLGKRSEDEDVLPVCSGLPVGNLTTIGNVEDIIEKELKREILEEIGVEIDNLKYLESHSHEKQIINMCFTADIISGEPEALDETEEVKWFTFKEVKELKLTPHTIERLKKVFRD